jgi:glyoxylase-like metal-dependent hydrolase (beta-lactamase superfamily II)
MDHAGGAGPLAAACEDATVLVHEVGAPFLVDPEKVERLVESVHRAVGALADGYGTMEPIPGERVETLAGGEHLDLGDRRLDVLHCTGHAPHQVALHDRERGHLFPADECGEYVGGTVLPSTPPPNFDLEANLRSLDRFADLDLTSLFYPHYGEHTDPYEALQTYRDTLTGWVERVERLREDHEGSETLAERVLDDGHPYADLYADAHSRELLRMSVEGVSLYLDD